MNPCAAQILVTILGSCCGMCIGNWIFIILNDATLDAGSEILKAGIFALAAVVLALALGVG